MGVCYFGFGLADSMFPDDCTIVRKPVKDTFLDEIREQGTEVVPCLNPSHAATVAVMRQRGIVVEIPPKAPVVSLKRGDSIVVLGVSGLPRLEGRHEYTPAEIAGAKFRMAQYYVSHR